MKSLDEDGDCETMGNESIQKMDMTMMKKMGKRRGIHGI